LPTLLNKAKNLVTTLAAVASHTFKTGETVLSSTAQEARLKACNGCDQLDREKMVCKGCGCFLKMKIPLTAATCPLKKWESQKVKRRSLGDLKNTTAVTNDTYAAAVASTTLTMVVYWTEECVACGQFIDVLKSAMKKFKGRIKVYRALCKDNAVNGKALGITKSPTTVFYRNGQVENVLDGSRSDEILIAHIAKLLE
jgi:hypothetical protein